MAYIYKKTIGEKSYYYLRLSKRVKGKVVTKDLAYLGTDISKIERKLAKVPEKYKQEIRKAYKNIKKYIENEFYLEKIKIKKLKKDKFLEKDNLEKCESIREHYKSVFLKLDKKTKNEFYENFIIDFSYNTTSLEGNTITLAEAVKLLKENLTPKNRTLREVYDLQNTKKVFFEILNKKEKISHKFVVNIHNKLLENIDKRKGYRTHEIRVFESRFKSSPPQYIQIDMDILIKWYNKNKKKLHPIVLASIFHQKFERIHPFSDGNGRTGRMILCYMLMNVGYAPVIIRKSRRGDYLDALADGNKESLDSEKVRAFKNIINFIAEEQVENYWNNFLV